MVVRPAIGDDKVPEYHCVDPAATDPCDVKIDEGPLSLLSRVDTRYITSPSSTLLTK